MIESQYVFDDERGQSSGANGFLSPCRQGNAVGSDMMLRVSTRPDEVCEYRGYWLEGL
jgi:hypothetical protein